MTATILLGFLPLIFFSFATLLALATTIFWVWMLVDCAQYETSENSSKIVWILVILFTHILGAILYFCIRKQARTGF
jgi:hypothetical protein